MADFCKQCTLELFGSDMPNDMAGITSKEDWKQGLSCLVLCEDCGPCQVDPEGNCISPDCLKSHGFKENDND